MDRFILAIGEESFGRELYEMLARLVDADRVLVIEAGKARAPVCIVDEGTSARISQQVFIRQARAVDYPAGRFQPAQADDLPTDASRQREIEVVRQKLPQINKPDDLFTFCVEAGKRRYTILVVRESNGLFSRSQLSQLNEAAEFIGSCILKDREKQVSELTSENALISRIISCSEEFSALTNREKSVCIGILTGHTTEAIGLHLGISINSILTYRRRLYQKLEINSQNELFMRVLKTARSL